jgi:hypothetical protein
MAALAALVASACVSAPVSYAAPPDHGAPAIPWIHAGAVNGYLFYYRAEGPWKRLTNRVVIATGGGPRTGYATKILWHVTGGASGVSITGRRLNGPGRFHQSFSATPTGGGSYFPSIVTVPTPGCWRIAVSSNGYTGRFAFVAVEP